MNGTRRIRVDLDAESYEALKYFGLLRGQPVGKTITRLLAIHATTIVQEDPSVRAHLLAWHAARSQQGAAASDNPVEGVS